MQRWGQGGVALCQTSPNPPPPPPPHTKYIQYICILHIANAFYRFRIGHAVLDLQAFCICNIIILYAVVTDSDRQCCIFYCVYVTHAWRNGDRKDIFICLAILRKPPPEIPVTYLCDILLFSLSRRRALLSFSE